MRPRAVESPRRQKRGIPDRDLWVEGGSMSDLRLRWLHTKTSIRDYTVAVLSTAVAVGIARWLDVHHESAPVSLLLCAVMLSAWLGGVGPGLLPGALSPAAIAQYLLNPTHSAAGGQRQTHPLVLFLHDTPHGGALPAD